MRRSSTQIAVGVALGVALMLLAQPLVTRWLSDERLHPVAVPDAGGALEHVAIQYTSAAGPVVAATYADLFGALPADVRIAVAVERGADFEDLVGRLADAGVAHRGLYPVITNRPITPWSRDRYTLARDGDRWLLVVPEIADGGNDARLNDWLVPWSLAARLPNTDVVRIPLRFDGGDLLVTRTHVIASWRLVEKNLGTFVATPAELVTRLEQAFGRPVMLFGDGPQTVPHHHIGMYITPLPDGRMVVGDPRLGLELIGEERAASLGADRDAERLARFDRVAADFVAAGFEVVRLPMVPLEGELDYVTYNNVLMETRNGQTIAYVPTYGLADLDAAALSQWEALGVRAHPIDVSAVYRFDGSVRCLVNVLRRGSVAPVAGAWASYSFSSPSS